jgi:hypothetical protein
VVGERLDQRPVDAAIVLCERFEDLAREPLRVLE